MPSRCEALIWLCSFLQPRSVRAQEHTFHLQSCAPVRLLQLLCDTTTQQEPHSACIIAWVPRCGATCMSASGVAVTVQRIEEAEEVNWDACMK